MGKKKATKFSLSVSSDSQDDFHMPLSQKNMGKPHSTPIEKVFMRRYQDGKKQEIQAQSKVEQICGRLKDLYAPIYAGRQSKSGEQNYSKEKLIWIRSWFFERGNEQFEAIWSSFVKGVQQWRYNDINTIQDFPDYQFVGESDLSYTLLGCLKNIQTKVEFDSSQLLLCQLLSLAVNDSLPFRILRIVETHCDEIVNKMTGLKQKIVSQYQKCYEAKEKTVMKSEEVVCGDLNEEKVHSMQQVVEKQKGIKELHEQLCKGVLCQNLPSENEDDDISKKIKRKFIGKGLRPAEKKCKGRPRSDSYISDDVTISELNQLLQAMMSHIAWAYKYIYPEELKKKARAVQ